MLLPSALSPEMRRTAPNLPTEGAFRHLSVLGVQRGSVGVHAMGLSACGSYAADVMSGLVVAPPQDLESVMAKCQSKHTLLFETLEVSVQCQKSGRRVCKEARALERAT